MIQLICYASRLCSINISERLGAECISKLDIIVLGFHVSIPCSANCEVPNYKLINAYSAGVQLHGNGGKAAIPLVYQSFW